MEADIRRQLMVLMQRHGIVELDHRDDDQEISLSLARKASATIQSPSIGIFHTNHPMSANRKPIAGRMKKGDLLGFLKNGPLLHPVIAETDCHIRVAKVVDGTLVGFGDALYEIA